MDRHRPKTLILGVGNILLSDEGIGVRVVEYLKSQTLPEEIELIDGGTAGADLIDVLADRETVIIVDAIQSDKPAGTIMQFGPDDLAVRRDNPLSLHDLDIPQTLAMTKMLHCAPKKIVFFGVVPESIEPGMELSKAVVSLLPEIARLILDAAVS